MDKYSDKLMKHFRGKVVRKDLTAMMKRGVNVPGYVLEYLLGSYCSTDDQEVIAAGVKKIVRILANNYVRADDIERIKYNIKEKGEYTIIDKIEGFVDENNDVYIGRFTNFDIGYFVLPPKYARQYPSLFTGGVWCMIKLQYNVEVHDDYDDDDDEYDYDRKVMEGNAALRRSRSRSQINGSYRIESLKPIQIPDIDISPIIEKRKEFTLEEWIITVLRSSGIEATNLNEKERMHFIERLVPLFERNYNLVELGPRGTGKSHVYKEISPHSILISGGQTSISNLFYNLQSHVVGLVGNWDTVAFDEVSGMKFNNPLGLQILKDYMASGSFTRGKTPVYADASLVFIGNINDSISNILKTSHLFSPFPSDFNSDAAFFDRIHYYLPGWEIPKIKADYLTNEYGFISDFFAEFAKQMRKHDYTHCFDEWFKFTSDVNVRDEIAIRKTVSGIIKILYPDGVFTKDDVEQVLIYAVEGRRRVKEQLRKIAGDEFAEVRLGYIRDDGKEVVVDVPERLDETLIASSKPIPGHVFTVGYSIAFEIPAVYKIEVKTIPGNGNIEVQGIRGVGKGVAMEAVNAGWKYFNRTGSQISRGSSLLNKDYLIYINDVQRKYASSEISVAEYIALCSALMNIPVREGLAIVGEVTLSGTLSHLKAVDDYIRCARFAGAKYVLLPSESKPMFEKIDPDEIAGITPLFYDTALEAARIALLIEK